MRSQAYAQLTRSISGAYANLSGHLTSTPLCYSNSTELGIFPCGLGCRQNILQTTIRFNMYGFYGITERQPDIRSKRNERTCSQRQWSHLETTAYAELTPTQRGAYAGNLKNEQR